MTGRDPVGSPMVCLHVICEVLHLLENVSSWIIVLHLLIILFTTSSWVVVCSGHNSDSTCPLPTSPHATKSSCRHRVRPVALFTHEDRTEVRASELNKPRGPHFTCAIVPTGDEAARHWRTIDCTPITQMRLQSAAAITTTASRPSSCSTTQLTTTSYQYRALSRLRQHLALVDRPMHICRVQRRRRLTQRSSRMPHPRSGLANRRRTRVGSNCHGLSLRRSSGTAQCQTPTATRSATSLATRGFRSRAVSLHASLASWAPTRLWLASTAFVRAADSRSTLSPTKDTLRYFGWRLTSKMPELCTAEEGLRVLCSRPASSHGGQTGDLGDASPRLRPILDYLSLTTKHWHGSALGFGTRLPCFLSGAVKCAEPL